MMVSTDMALPHRWTLAATVIGSSLTFVDATVVNVALPALQAGLHATITDVQWVIEAYGLFLGALILVGGSMGDQFGRKRVFVTGIALFTGASVLCGLAGSVRVLIAGRALQGIGAALLVPESLAIITATFDDEGDRGRAIGVWAGFSAIMSAVGPVLGGWLIGHVSWRAVFFLNVPFAIAALLLSWEFMAESRDPSRTGRIDWWGTALAVTGLGGITLGLLQWPEPDASRVVVAAALVIGAACLGLLPVAERRARNPILPFHLFRSRTFSLANLLTLLLYAALGVGLFLVPMDLIQIQHYTPTEAGAALLPFPAIMFLLSRWSGGLVARLGSRLPLTAGPVVAAAGFALYARPGLGGSYWTTFFPAAVALGLGMAIAVAPLTTSVLGAVEATHAGVASGINNAVARIAGLLAIAIFGVVLVRGFDAHVRPALGRIDLAAPARAAIDRELPKLAGADLGAVSLAPAQRAAVRRDIDEAFLAAFRRVLLAAAALALAAGATGAAIQGQVATPGRIP
jgi:EmrB/QacA subfamily drug resistance transporter